MMPATSLPPPREGPPRILVVDDDYERRASCVRVLHFEGYEVDELDDGDLVVDRVLEHPPDLLLLEAELPGADGFEVCGELRMLDEARLTPIILVGSSRDDESAVVRGLLSGADDVCAHERMNELKARVRVQLRNRRDRELLQWARQQRTELRSAALNDALTGIPNRRSAERAMLDALSRNDPCMVILLDVDHFKNVNDTWGHAAGDEVLKGVAATLDRQARRNDTVARFGGEEFVVLIRGAAAEMAVTIAERFRVAIEQTTYDCAVPGVTASFGVAVWTGEGRAPSVAAMLSLADEGLYAAKHAGRNRVCVRMLNPISESPPSETPQPEEKVA